MMLEFPDELPRHIEFVCRNCGGRMKEVVLQATPQVDGWRCAKCGHVRVETMKPRVISI
jgi:uncharacterized Zn finger protein